MDNPRTRSMLTLDSPGLPEGIVKEEQPAGPWQCGRPDGVQIDLSQECKWAGSICGPRKALRGIRHTSKPGCAERQVPRLRAPRSQAHGGPSEVQDHIAPTDASSRELTLEPPDITHHPRPTTALPRTPEANLPSQSPSIYPRPRGYPLTHRALRPPLHAASPCATY
jgi:hypothetical protein